MPSLRALSVVALAIAGCLLASGPVRAQFGPSGEQFARVLDRNGDGIIDPDEMARLPDRMLNSLEESGIDIDQPISAEDLAETMSRRFEAMRAEREAADYASWDRDRSPGEPSRPSSGSSASNAPAPKRPTLPSEFASADTDRDGQIGYYEWRAWKGRAALADFRRHDRNGDGFLTPRELELGPISLPATVTPAAPAAVASAAGATPASAGATPATRAGATTTGSSSSSSPGSESTEEAAHRFYGMIDKDKNGKLSMSEWEISRRIRGMFEADKLTLADMTEADFVAHYVRLSEVEATSDKSGSDGSRDGNRRGRR